MLYLIARLLLLNLSKKVMKMKLHIAVILFLSFYLNYTCAQDSAQQVEYKPDSLLITDRYLKDIEELTNKLVILNEVQEKNYKNREYHIEQLEEQVNLLSKNYSSLSNTVYSSLNEKSIKIIWSFWSFFMLILILLQWRSNVLKKGKMNWLLEFKKSGQSYLAQMHYSLLCLHELQEFSKAVKSLNMFRNEEENKERYNECLKEFKNAIKELDLVSRQLELSLSLKEKEKITLLDMAHTQYANLLLAYKEQGRIEIEFIEEKLFVAEIKKELQEHWEEIESFKFFIPFRKQRKLFSEAIKDEQVYSSSN